MKLSSLVIAGMLFSSATSHAGAKGPQKPPGKAAASQMLDLSDGKAVRSFLRDVKTARVTRLRAGAKFFAKIAIQKDYSNEHVVMANSEVTAFLDMTDPLHPNYDPEGEQYPELDALPEARRTHILVVPNKLREHLTPSLGDRIGLGDLVETAKVVKAAEALAADLGIKNAKVFINPSEHLSIGYLHVHIIGEKAANQGYPKL